MNLLSASHLTKIGRQAPLFTDLSFGLDEGEKCALIGRNGCGKSSLLACIFGQLEPDGGNVALNREAGISYLAQEPAYKPEDSIRDHVFGSPSPKLGIIRSYLAICQNLAEEPAGSRRAQSLQESLEGLSHEMDSRGLWNYEHSIRSILTTLGIASLDLKMGSLSGGMLKKVALAQVLIEDSRLLLLDEPTNHLDLSTIAWLETYLATTDRGVLMVTHDRYFLDAVCTSIYELEGGRLNHYEGNFSTYLEKKALAMEERASSDNRLKSILRGEREWLLRGPCARGTKAQARIDSIHRKMEELRLSQERLKRDKCFTFEVSGRRLGGKVLEAEGLCKSFSGPDGQAKPVIRDFSYIFRKGERIGVFGDNGSGKSTLLNLLTQDLECDSGRLARGENTVFGYYRQNPVFSSTAKTVLDYVREEAEQIPMASGAILSASQLLERFGFEGSVQHSPVTTLSGGERKRLYLVRLLMAKPNFLVLDEPTNDFDIHTMSALESFLEGFGGCLLVVSHDRFFMDRVAQTLFILEDDASVSGFVGSCSDYISLRALEKTSAKTQASQARPSNEDLRQRKKKRSFKEQREYEVIEGDISALEGRKAELEGLMAGGESDHRKLRDMSLEFERISAELQEKYTRWEYLAQIE